MEALFRELGLTAKEARAFLKMLSLGAQPASVIAKQVGVPRSSMYTILERLQSLGLIEVFERAGISYFVCIPVQDIADILHAKERSVNHALSLLEERLPSLEALERKLSITPQVRFFEGRDAAKKMYEEIIKKEKDFFSIFNPAAVKSMFPEYFYSFPEAFRKKGASLKEFVVNCPEGNEYQTTFQTPLHEIKILPPRVTFASDTILCLTTIYMVSYGEKQICGTAISSMALSQTQRVLFLELWKRIS